MKKIITFVVCCLLGVVNVSALENDSYVQVNYDDYIFSNRQIGDEFYSGQQGIVYVNGKVAYCLDPTVFLNNDIYSSSKDFSIAGISKEQLEYLEIVSYFGYGYNGRDDSKYYYATQEIIWEYLTGGEVYWTSSRGGSIVNIDTYKNEIINSINHYLTLPDLPNYSETYTGTDIILEDKNDVLEYYNPDLWLATINNNKLTLSAEFNGTVTINLVKRPLNYESSYIYVSENSQNLATFGYSSDKTTSIPITYKVIALSQIRLVKMDMSNMTIIKNRETKVKIFDVAKNQYIVENGTDIFTIGESGLFETQTYLEEGEYRIEEVSAPSGYKKLNNPQTFNIYEYHGPMTEVIIYNEPLTYNLNIHKMGEVYKGFEKTEDSISGIYHLEDMNKVKYGLFAQEDIYDVSGNVLYKKYALVMNIDIINGYGSAQGLVYGKYYLKEIECPKDYVLDQTIIDIDFTKEEQTINLQFTNYLKKGDIIIRKVDNQIGIKGATFTFKGQKYSHSTNLESGNFGYIKIENIPYDTYILEEIKAPLGYELDPNEKELVLNTSELHYDFINKKMESEQKEPLIPETPKEDEEPPVEEKEPEEVILKPEEPEKEIIEIPDEESKEENKLIPDIEIVEPEVNIPAEPSVEEKESEEIISKPEIPEELPSEEQGTTEIPEKDTEKNLEKDEIVSKDNITIEETVPNPSTLVSLEYKSFLPHILLYISIVFGILNIKIKP